MFHKITIVVSYLKKNDQILVWNGQIFTWWKCAQLYVFIRLRIVNMLINYTLKMLIPGFVPEISVISPRQNTTRRVITDIADITSVLVSEIILACHNIWFPGMAKPAEKCSRIKIYNHSLWCIPGYVVGSVLPPWPVKSTLTGISHKTGTEIPVSPPAVKF